MQKRLNQNVPPDQREMSLNAIALISEVKLFTITNSSGCETHTSSVLRELLTLLEIAFPSTSDIIIPSIWQAQRVWGIFRFLSDSLGIGFLTSTWVIKGQFSLIDIFKLIMDCERIITYVWRCKVDSINFFIFYGVILNCNMQEDMQKCC